MVYNQILTSQVCKDDLYSGNFYIEVHPIGHVLAVGASVIFAFYNILLKKVPNTYHPVLKTRKIFFYGLLTMVPFVVTNAAHFNESKLFQLHIIVPILFLGIVASSLCFLMWNTAVTMIGVVSTSTYIYFVPIITLITSVLVLKEKITYLAGIGIIGIIVGVFISDHGVLKIRKLVHTRREKEEIKKEKMLD